MGEDISILNFEININTLKVVSLNDEKINPLLLDVFFDKHLSNDKLNLNYEEYSFKLFKKELLKVNKGERIIYRTFDIDIDVVFTCVDEKNNVKSINVSRIKSNDLNSHLFDKLTKVYTRDIYENSIQKCLKEEDNTNSYLLMIDFDNFKTVNDTKGHDIGDVCLKVVVDEIKEIFKGHLIGRYGGDEFIVFLRDVEPYELEELVKKALNATYFIKNKNRGEIVTVSIGVSSAIKERNDYDVIFKETDEALYKAKEFKNTAKIFNGEFIYGERTIKKPKKTTKKKPSSRLLLKEEIKKRSIIFITCLVLGVLVIVGLVGAADILFNINVNNQVNETAYTLMNKEADTVKLLSNKTINDSFTKLKNVDKATKNIDESTQEDTLNKYYDIMKNTCLIDNPGILLTDGTLCYEGGKYNIASYETTSTLIYDKKEIIDRITMNNKLDSVLVGEPYNKDFTFVDGSTLSIGAVVSLNNATKFSEEIFDSISSYNYVSLIESYGRKIVENTNSENKIFKDCYNILNYFDDDEESKAKIVKALLDNNDTIQILRIDGVNYFVYVGTMKNESYSWRVVMFTPYNNIYNTFGKVVSVSVLMTNILAIILLVVLISSSIIIYTSHMNSFKERYTDHIINSINKERFFIDGETVLNSSSLNHYLVYMNIKNFKAINSEFNSMEADGYLGKVAEVLDTYLSNNELLSREYSDRFILLLNGGKEADIKERIKAIIVKLQKDERLKIGSSVLSFNIGYYSFDMENHTEIWLAIDRAKRASTEIDEVFGVNNTICEYNKEMLIDDELVRFIEENQEAALQDHKFDVFYQGKYDLKNQCFGGCEALVRWKDGSRGYINTQRMVDVFEDNGFINKLDIYVFETVLRDLKLRIESGHKVVPVSINLSRRHFENSDFFISYKHLLNSYKIDPSLIEFEITESIILNNDIDLNVFIKEIHDLGCKVDIDDFGSGYSNLALITQVDFDVIKLDRKLLFGKNKEFDSNCKRVLQSVIYLNKNNGKTIVCEGVDTKEQVDFLTQMGCDYIQGFYYCRPINRMEFADLLDKDKKSDK